MQKKRKTKAKQIIMSSPWRYGDWGWLILVSILQCHEAKLYSRDKDRSETGQEWAMSWYQHWTEPVKAWVKIKCKTRTDKQKQWPIRPHASHHSGVLSGLELGPLISSNWEQEQALVQTGGPDDECVSPTDSDVLGADVLLQDEHTSPHQQSGVWTRFNYHTSSSSVSKHGRRAGGGERGKPEEQAQGTKKQSCTFTSECSGDKSKSFNKVRISVHLVNIDSSLNYNKLCFHYCCVAWSMHMAPAAVWRRQHLIRQNRNIY